MDTAPRLIANDASKEDELDERVCCENGDFRAPARNWIVRWSVHRLEILALKFCDHNPSFHKISSSPHTDLQVEEAAYRPF